MAETLSGFVQRVKNIMADTGTDYPHKTSEYLDLADLNADKYYCLDQLISNEATPVDPLSEVLAITLQQVQLGQVDKVKLAINELLKDYLVKVNSENQNYLTKAYLNRLKQIFTRCMQSDFPFHDEVWDYIGSCVKSVGLCLFERECFIGVGLLLETVAQMGRNAAHKGLPTSNTQACLRALENKAIAKDCTDIALAAKNFRFNMET